MSVESEQDRKILQNMRKEHVEKAMELFDRKIRKDFKENRWKRWVLLHNGKSYPPKDLLRCAIAVMKNSSYDLASVKGGGTSINKYFTPLGFVVADIKKPADNINKSILRKASTNILSSGTFSGETPSKEAVENILRSAGGEADEDTLKEAIEDFFEKEKRTLRPDWWEITKKNLLEWSKKR